MASFDDYPESGTIAEVKEWVGDDRDRAEHAYDHEADSDNPRVTLISWLEDRAYGDSETQQVDLHSGEDVLVHATDDDGPEKSGGYAAGEGPRPDDDEEELVEEEVHGGSPKNREVAMEDLAGGGPGEGFDVTEEDEAVPETMEARLEAEGRSGGEIEPYASGPDVVTADDLTIAQLAKSVPGLLAAGNAVDPNPVRSQIGNSNVTLYTVDGTDTGAAANVRGTVMNFPVVSVAEATAFRTAWLAGTTLPAQNRISKPALNTSYAPYIDAVVGPIDYGRTPTENSASKKLAQIPVIGDKQINLNDAFIEQATGLYWVCTTAGDPVENGTIKDIVQFRAFVPVRKENLDQWDAEWIHNNLYTQDYVKFNQDYVAALANVPTDWSNYASTGYTLAVRANASRKAFGPGSVLNANLSVASPNSGTDDATWEAKFASAYVVGGVVHPSAVSYLRSAFYEAGDTRPETYDTGFTYLTLNTPQNIKGAVYDVKLFGLYEGGDGVMANSVLGIGPMDVIGSVPALLSVNTVANGATSIVANGTAFNANSKLYVNDVAASSTVNTATTSTGTVSAQTAGSKRIRVDNSNVVTVVVP